MIFLVWNNYTIKHSVIDFGTKKMSLQQDYTMQRFLFMVEMIWFLLGGRVYKSESKNKTPAYP